MHDGKTRVFLVASEVAFGTPGKTIDKAADVGEITKTDKGILNLSQMYGVK